MAGSSMELYFPWLDPLFVLKCELAVQRMWWKKEDAQRHNKMEKNSRHFMVSIFAHSLSLVLV